MADDEQDKHTVASCIQGYYVYSVCPSTSSVFVTAMALDGTVHPRAGVQHDLVSWDKLPCNRYFKIDIVVTHVYTCVYIASLPREKIFV